MTASKSASPYPTGEIKILIATPCYTGQCYTGYVTSMMKTLSSFAAFNKVKLLHKFINYDCSIPKARNYFVATMLEDPSITHILFIDADMKWEPEDIGKLIMAKKPIIGAAIPKKKYYWERLRLPKLRELIMDDKLSDEDFQKQIKMYLVDYAVNLGDFREAENGVMEVESIGTAFVLIERTVFEKLIKSNPSRKIDIPPPGLPKQFTEHFYALFDQENVDGLYLSSDYSFCRRWKNIGGKVYADISINLGHQGYEEFEGNLLSISKITSKLTKPSSSN